MSREGFNDEPISFERVESKEGIKKLYNYLRSIFGKHRVQIFKDESIIQHKLIYGDDFI